MSLRATSPQASPIYFYATVTCAHSGSQPRRRAPANKDGLAVDDKRERYAAEGVS